MIEEPLKINGSEVYNHGEYIGTFSIDTYNNATLYIPLGTTPKYKVTEGWKDFKKIVEE